MQPCPGRPLSWSGTHRPLQCSGPFSAGSCPSPGLTSAPQGPRPSLTGGCRFPGSSLGGLVPSRTCSALGRFPAWLGRELWVTAPQACLGDPRWPCPLWPSSSGVGRGEPRGQETHTHAGRPSPPRNAKGLDRLLHVPQPAEGAGEAGQRPAARRGVHVHTPHVAGPPPGPGPRLGPEAAPAAPLGRVRGNVTLPGDSSGTGASCAGPSASSPWCPGATSQMRTLRSSLATRLG